VKIAVSPGLSHLDQNIIQQNHSYDVSIILWKDRAPWMERAFRSLHPHYVRSVEEGEAVYELYKEFISEERANYNDSGQ
jgi:hypothetical protein